MLYIPPSLIGTLHPTMSGNTNTPKTTTQIQNEFMFMTTQQKTQYLSTPGSHGQMRYNDPNDPLYNTFEAMVLRTQVQQSNESWIKAWEAHQKPPYQTAVAEEKTSIFTDYSPIQK